MKLIDNIERKLFAWYDRHVMLVFHVSLVFVVLMVFIQAIRALGG